MSSDKCINHVKTLFLICNSVWFALGWLCFASGVGIAAINGSTTQEIMDIVAGLVMIFVTFCGFCAAIAEKKKTLHGYCSFMVFIGVREIIQLVKCKPAPRGVGHDKMSDAELEFVSHIFFTIITLVTLLLTCALLGQLDDSDNTDADNANVSKKRDVKVEENAVATAKLFP